MAILPIQGGVATYTEQKWGDGTKALNVPNSAPDDKEEMAKWEKALKKNVEANGSRAPKMLERRLPS